MDHHLTGSDGANSRNGYGRKTVLTETGQIQLEVPRDRQSSFDPQLIAKYHRRFSGDRRGIARDSFPNCSGPGCRGRIEVPPRPYLFQALGCGYWPADQSSW